MSDKRTPSMTELNPPETSRTYVYKSGHRYTLQNVVAVGIEKGWDRIKTGDGRLHVVLLVIGHPDSPIDYCVAKELECAAWTF